MTFYLPLGIVIGLCLSCLVWTACIMVAVGRRPEIEVGPLEFDGKFKLWTIRVTSRSRREIFPHVVVTDLRIANVGPVPAMRRSFEAHWREGDMNEDPSGSQLSLRDKGCWGVAGPFWLMKLEGDPVLVSYPIAPRGKTVLFRFDLADRPPTFEADLVIYAQDPVGHRSTAIQKTVQFRPDPHEAYERPKDGQPEHTHVV